MSVLSVKITSGGTGATLKIDQRFAHSRTWKRVSSNKANVCPDSGLWESSNQDLLINDNEKNPVMIFKKFGNAQKGDYGQGIFKGKGFAIAPNVLISWEVTDEGRLP